MPIQEWSENILLVELQNDPQFADDMNALLERVESSPELNVVINLAPVQVINSSNIAKLLKLRKVVTISNNRKLKLCGINTHVWGVFLVTGLDKLFEYADTVAEGLTAVQIDTQLPTEPEQS